jgi:predicted DNA-binding protein
MAKELLSVRIPDELMRKINMECANTKRDKTAIAIELLERGLESLGNAPIKSENYATTQDLETLRGEILEIKKLSLAA